LKKDNIDIRARALVLLGNKIACIKQLVGQDELWVLPGGGVEYSEVLTDALSREIIEEIGVTISPNVKMVGCRENIILGYYRSYEFYFLCEYVSGDIKAGIEPENGKVNQRILEANWLPIDALSSLQVRPQRNWLLQHLLV